MDGFLNDMSDRYVLQCPTGCGSQKDKSMMIMSGDMASFRIYEDHVDEFNDLKNAVDGTVGGKISTAQLKFSALSRHWSK